MTEHWIAPVQMFDAGRLHQGRALRIVDGQVAAVCDLADLPADLPCDIVAGVLTPGFVDLQVNGGGGVLFNQSPDAAGISAIIAAHRQFGTVALLATVITDTPQVLADAAQAALAMRGHAGFAGLHIEGPHIALARRGTHAAAHIRQLDETSLRIVQHLRANDVTVMITLAPEAATPVQISALAGMGAIVSLGHSDSTAAQARTALVAGARAVTHLFNAMSQMQGRAPGLAGVAINSDAYVGVICDGVHVDDTMIALAHRARPVPGRMMLVSDSMPTVGGPDHFDLYGQTIRLDQGRLVNAAGNLAGAHCTMLDGVQRLVAGVGLSLEQALHMAVSAPAGLLGARNLDAVHGRALDDLFVLDATLGLAPLSRYIRRDIA